MPKENIAKGTLHKVPIDLKRALGSAPKALLAWNGISPLARNEWICWNISVKQQVTRENHIKRTVAELQEGKRRPCCWVGCIHRKDKAMSPTQKWVTNCK